MSRPPAKTPKSGEAADEATKSNKRLITGVAVGIGSAAIVAALLYANRSRKND
jgi:hypothetical protein